MKTRSTAPVTTVVQNGRCLLQRVRYERTHRERLEGASGPTTDHRSRERPEGANERGSRRLRRLVMLRQAKPVGMTEGYAFRTITEGAKRLPNDSKRWWGWIRRDLNWARRSRFARCDSLAQIHAFAPRTLGSSFLHCVQKWTRRDLNPESDVPARSLRSLRWLRLTGLQIRPAIHSLRKTPLVYGLVGI